MMDTKPDLAALRKDIDALDGELRTLLRMRAELVSKVALSKAQNGDVGTLRPLREAQQMAALLAWQKAEAADLTAPGLLAIWREIISMALAQQGGLTIHASPAAMMAARGHFGASLDYVEADAAQALRACAATPAAVAVLALDEAQAPQGAAQVIARLPVTGEAAFLCYGHNGEMDEARQTPGFVSLIHRPAPQKGDCVVRQLADGVLVESQNDAPSAGDSVWGGYLPVEGHDA